MHLLPLAIVYGNHIIGKISLGDVPIGSGPSETMKKKRQLLITIDGDGLLWETCFPGRKAGEVFYDNIITKYPFLFTASVIAGDVVQSTDNSSLALAKRILNSTNVEAASHSWTHPRDWRTKGIDHKLEIKDSINYINQKILSKDKTVKIFLWTGMCNPSEDAFKVLDETGIPSLNGSNIEEPFINIGAYRHYMSRAYPDWHYMNLKDIWFGPLDPKQGHILTTHPGNFGGFKEIISHFASHNLPIHLWLHWYSAIRSDSLDAIKYVLDWCLSQDLESIFASDYIFLLQEECSQKQKN